MLFPPFVKMTAGKISSSTSLLLFNKNSHSSPVMSFSHPTSALHKLPPLKHRLHLCLSLCRIMLLHLLSNASWSIVNTYSTPSSPISLISFRIQTMKISFIIHSDPYIISWNLTNQPLMFLLFQFVFSSQSSLLSLIFY